LRAEEIPLSTRRNAEETKKFRQFSTTFYAQTGPIFSARIAQRIARTFQFVSKSESPQAETLLRVSDESRIWTGLKAVNGCYENLPSLCPCSVSMLGRMNPPAV